MIKGSRLYKIAKICEILFAEPGANYKYTQKEYQKIFYHVDKRGLQTVANQYKMNHTHRIRGIDLINYLKDNTIEGVREEVLDWIEDYNE